MQASPVPQVGVGCDDRCPNAQDAGTNKAQLSKISSFQVTILSTLRGARHHPISLAYRADVVQRTSQDNEFKRSSKIGQDLSIPCAFPERFRRPSRTLGGRKYAPVRCRAGRLLVPRRGGSAICRSDQRPRKLREPMPFIGVSAAAEARVRSRGHR